MKKQKNIKNKSRTNGRWTKTQHDRFMKGLQRYGRDWISVQKVVKTRTLTQVRSHAQKVFLKLSNQQIDALIADENQYQILKYTSNMESQEDFQSQSLDVEPLTKKQNPKTQLSLLDIFMNAIEEQSKQVSPQQDHSKIMQQQETKLQIKDLCLKKKEKSLELSEKQNEIPHCLPFQRKKESLKFDQQQKSFNTNLYPIRLNLQETFNTN